MSNKITQESIEIASQYWSANLADEQETLEELFIDQAEALSCEIGVEMSMRIINASDRIDIAESVLNKLNKLKK
tara:strand:+ start:1543 stop:1764 length:222 start_codon:yes stop_codon:yes gene_type:complete